MWQTTPQHKREFSDSFKQQNHTQSQPTNLQFRYSHKFLSVCISSVITYNWLEDFNYAGKFSNNYTSLPPFRNYLSGHGICLYSLPTHSAFMCLLSYMGSSNHNDLICYMKCCAPGNSILNHTSVSQRNLCISRTKLFGTERKAPFSSWHSRTYEKKLISTGIRNKFCDG